MTLTPINGKQLILEDAKERILKNHTLKQIAISHGITERTLKKWLVSMDEEYREVRQVWIDNMLANAKNEIGNVTKKLSFAKANSKII